MMNFKIISLFVESGRNFSVDKYIAYVTLGLREKFV